METPKAHEVAKVIHRAEMERGCYPQKLYIRPGCGLAGVLVLCHDADAPGAGFLPVDCGRWPDLWRGELTLSQKTARLVDILSRFPLFTTGKAS